MNTATYVEQADGPAGLRATRVRFGKSLRPRNAVSQAPVYELTDLLQEERTVRVHAGQIVGIVSTWLAELDIHSPLVEDLARAVREGNWPAAYSIGENLCVAVAVAA